MELLEVHMCNVCMKYDTFSGVVSVVFRGTEGSSVVSVIMRPSKDVTFRTKEDCYIAKYIAHYTRFDFFHRCVFPTSLEWTSEHMSRSSGESLSLQTYILLQASNKF